MFETSQSTEKLDAALAKAQGEILAASKDSVNPHYQSKYADLTAVWNACREALSKHGINATQWPIHSADARLHIVTRLGHAGEWMKAEFSIPVQKQDAHGFGSATTYAKRFALAAAVGVVADEEIDDDGNGAHDFHGSQQNAAQPKARPAGSTQTQSGRSPVLPKAVPQALADPGKFKITSGKYSGKLIESLSHEQILESILSIEKWAAENGKNLDDFQPAKEFIRYAKQYLSQGDAVEPGSFQAFSE